MIKSLYPCFQHWSAKGSVWLISDTHFDDPDCKYMNENWISPEEHIYRLSFLTKNDTLIHLGDVGNPKYLTELKCYKVLIMGNHDQSKTKFEPYFNEIYSGPLMIGPKILLSHEPIDVPWAFNIHGHDHDPENAFGCNHINLASNVVYWTPYNLDKDLIQMGWMTDIPSIHRITIDKATKQKTSQKN